MSPGIMKRIISADHWLVIANLCLVIADDWLVIADVWLVIADLIRNPCSSNSWITGAATPDLIRGRYDNVVLV